MIIRRVTGSSMTPKLKAGAVVVAFRRSIRPGSVVVADLGGREVVKRVAAIEHDRVYLRGDNRYESTDSRHYGGLPKHAIIGTVMMTFPSATNPPKPVKPYGVWLGRVAALVLIMMATVHLFRIDTFIPLLQATMQADGITASLLALVIIMSEVFAVPFALRMRLSPLGHLLSGALMLAAPLLWLFVSAWALGVADNTGQLGQFVTVPATVFIVVLNVLWLAYNHVTLYTLGFNTLRLSHLLSK